MLSESLQDVASVIQQVESIQPPTFIVSQTLTYYIILFLRISLMTKEMRFFAINYYLFVTAK